MQFVNLTPHAITVRVDNPHWNQFAGDENSQALIPEMLDTVIPPSGTVARVSSRTVPVLADGEIPFGRTEFGDVAGLPELTPGVMFIVSMIVRQAVPEREDVCSPDTGPDAFRNAEGQIEAVRRFIVN